MPFCLKSLELHGYKTFANRTLFEFSETVTAIVGPNGSGKSNIADSLRWVLGEQSYSLLRAKKTEDMIFSGSESRPRAGMASATITFDNSAGWLPIDFSEVAITRRAYRDGENEYLLNGQRVRLRDVGELLAQSGLAERTYTVIGQGLVDAALSLKAEERRRLFEEAAGIGLHRSRREEALRRLEATRHNLERVQDILAELQPRLNSLEKQARRAREYEQVKADLQVLLRDWYGYHWHRSQRELAEAREAARDQEARLKRTRREHAESEAKLDGLRQRIQGLRAELNTWHRQLAQLHTQSEGLSRNLAVADERERLLLGQQKNTQVELTNLEQEFGARQAQLEVINQEIEQMRLELEDANAQAVSARQALEMRQVERANAEEAMRVARQELASLNSRHGQLQARLSERQRQVEKAQKALDAARQALVTAEKDRQAAEGRFEERQCVEAEAEKAQKGAEEALLNHRQRLQAAETVRKHALEERSVIQAKLARLKAQLDVLEQAEATFTGYASGTRIVLQAAQEKKLQGTLGALSNYLEVPAEFETAIAAALGEYLDAVLLQNDPEQALILLEKEVGRGALLPLADLKPGEMTAPILKCMEGTLGKAVDLVKIAPEFRPAVDLLLGQVLIVKDRQAARLALTDQPVGVRVVTLRGEVFHASGPIQTRGMGDRENQTLLSRARQKRETASQLLKVEGQAKRLNERIQHLEDNLRDLLANGNRLEQAEQKSHRLREEAEAASHQANLVVEQARQQVRWQKEQGERLQAEMTRDQEDAAKFEAELAQVEKQLVKAREQVRHKTSDLEMLALDEFQSQAAHWNTRMAVAEQASNDSRTRLQDQRTGLATLQRTQAGLQQRMSEIQASLDALSADKTAQRQAETESGAQITALQEKIEPAENERDLYEQEQTDLQKAEAAARQTLSMTEHFNAQTRITLDRRQESLQALKRRIEDDFGLVAFEYVEQVSGQTPLPLEGMVEQLPRVVQLNVEIEEAIKRQRAQLRRMGPINPEAQAEHLEVKQRFEFLNEQMADLERAEQDVRQAISELDTLMEREFLKTFQAVAAEFKQIFTRLFGGGSARLILTAPEDLTTTGIDIEARLPGRRTQGLSLLSGGERSLTAVALIFALLKVSPTPFCVLDEVDAMLDEINVGRFRDLLGELSQNTQFVIVTHNRNTVQVAEVIYGVTMGRDSASQVLSLKLDEVNQVVE